MAVRQMERVYLDVCVLLHWVKWKEMRRLQNCWDWN